MFDFIKYLTKFLILCMLVCIFFSFSIIYFKQITSDKLKNVQIIYLLKEQIIAIKDFINADFINIFKLWLHNSIMLLIVLYSLKLIRDKLQCNIKKIFCYQSTLRLILLLGPMIIGVLIGNLNVKVYHIIGNNFNYSTCVTFSMIFFHGLFETTAIILLFYNCFYKTYQKALVCVSSQELLEHINGSSRKYFKTLILCFTLLLIAAYIEIQGLNAAWIYINHL